MSTPILSGTDTASRKGYGKPFGPGHHDSPINGGSGMHPIPPPPMPHNSMGPPMGPQCGPLVAHTSPTIQLHNRAHPHSQAAHLQAMEAARRAGGGAGGGGGDGDEDASSTAGGHGGGGGGFGCKNPNKLFGVSPSDIDKYSRVVFPVCFVCFNLMYWIIYLHISATLTEDLVLAT